MTTSPLMTTAEVANYTRLSVETLRYFRQRDEGPPFANFWRRVMYRRLDVDAWIESSVVPNRIARRLTPNGTGIAGRTAGGRQSR